MTTRPRPATGVLRHSSAGAYIVEADHPIRYRVSVADGVLGQFFPFPEPGDDGDPLGRLPGGSVRRLVVVDRDVARVYGDQIRDFLTRHDIEFRLIILRGGESSKSLTTVKRLCRAFDSFGVNRCGEPVIIFGGGVLLDVVGLAASIYRRGVPRIVFPTTLVSQIDAGLGLKTAIDFGRYKNRLGTYAAFQSATVDRQFLATLDARNLSDGLAEILKVGVAVDATLFDLLRYHGATVLTESFQGRTEESDRVARAIHDKAIAGTLGSLAPNLLEHDMCHPLYVGHTWSLAVEMEALRRSRRVLRWRRRPALLHGEAVALDTVLSAGISLERGHLDKAQYEDIAETTHALGLPLWDSLLGDDDLLSAGLHDTIRHRGGDSVVPLLNGIGGVVVARDITGSEVARAVNRQRALGGRCLG